MNYFFVLGLVFTLSAEAKKLSDLPGMPDSSFGEKAIEKHREVLDKISQKYNMPEEKLIAGLRNDHSLRITEQGNLYYVEQAPIESPVYLNDSSEILNYQISFIPDSEALKLHSRPGAKRVLLLDFNGHRVDSRFWSENVIDALPMSMDADPAFSTAELQMIKEIWLRVSEDYAPFDVDITTEEMSDADLMLRKGQRVIITQTSAWYGEGAGGVAPYDVIDWQLNIPAWVFSTLLKNNVKNVSECTSHELGHAIGLSHHSQYSTAGVFEAEYSSGIGTGDSGWAPIMGLGYSRKNTTWHNGSSSLTFTDIQDDVQELLMRFPLISDDAPNALSSTSSLNLRGSVSAGSIKFKHQGMIEARGDVDVLRMQLGQGTLSLSIQAPTYRLNSLGLPVQGNNLDFRVILKDANGVVISDQDPPGSVDVSINISDLAAGTYFLEIKAAPHIVLRNGVIEPSDYGSLGRYYISGTGVSSGLAVVALAPFVSAGADKSITLPSSSVSLAGAAADSDGTIVSQAWSQVSGPVKGIIDSPSSLMSSVSGLSLAGSYTFRLAATDSQGISSNDDVIIKVNPAPVAPVVSAGSDKSITLPTSAISLAGSASDSDGSIASVAWSQVSGPTQGLFSAPSSLSTSVSGLSVAGTYTFRLRATDSQGLSSMDDVVVTVKSSTRKRR
jgi:hypothetical protein